MDCASASDVDELLHEAFDARLLPLGFERVRQRAWVRSAKPHIRDLLEFQTLKGGTRLPVWGWSLDFVPHVSGRRSIRWHRTPKSALFDLSYDPLDYGPSGRRLRWEVPFGWAVRVEHTRARAKQLPERLIPEAEPFWSGVQTVTDLPRAIQEKRERPFIRFGFENYIQEQLAEAFVAAALGNEDCHTLLEGWIVEYQVDPVAADGLRERLRQRLSSPLA